DGQNTSPSLAQAFAISGGVGERLRRLLLSHPPLTERIAALRAASGSAM
ncbi:protease HtpX, partial [Xanthomonas perforans]|nr:protease HtpX [Xanthomonas perforans]